MNESKANIDMNTSVDKKLWGRDEAEFLHSSFDKYQLSVDQFYTSSKYEKEREIQMEET